MKTLARIAQSLAVLIVCRAAAQPTLDTPYTITQSVGYRSAANISDNTLGGVSSWDTKTSLQYSKPIDRTLAIMQLSWTFSNWDFDNAPLLKQTHDIDLGIRAIHRFDGSRWSALAMGGLGFGGENETAFSHGQRLRGGLAAGYRFNEKLSAFLGIMITDREENDATFLPIISIDWQISEKLKLQTRNGATLTWEPSDYDSSEISFFVEYDTSAWRTREQTVPGVFSGEALVEESRLTVGIGAAREILDDVRAGIRLSSDAWREFEIRRNDARVADFDADPAFNAELSLSARF